MSSPLHRYSREQSVLIVDDDKFQLELFYHQIGGYFKEVDITTDPQEALDLYKKKKHNIIFSDILMPNISGKEFIKRVRLINPEQKVVVVSSIDESNEIIELIDLDVDSFINKPIDKDRLETVLFKICMNISDSIIASKYEEKLIDMNIESKKEIKLLKGQINSLEDEIQKLKTNT